MSAWGMPPVPAAGFTKMHDGLWRGYNQSSPKWRCDTCRREGYGTSDHPYEWARTCLQGHAPCPWCGRQQALRKDGTPRVHSRCSDRPDDAELLRLLVAEVRHEGRLAVRGPFDRTAERLLDRLTAPNVVE